MIDSEWAPTPDQITEALNWAREFGRLNTIASALETEQKKLARVRAAWFDYKALRDTPRERALDEILAGGATSAEKPATGFSAGITVMRTDWKVGDMIDLTESREIVRAKIDAEADGRVDGIATGPEMFLINVSFNKKGIEKLSPSQSGAS